jgi:PAS domain S-box-containing protein
VGIAHVGLDGGWLRLNAKLCEILGYSAEELRPHTFQEITHPDDLEADLAYTRRLLDGDIASFSMEKRYIRKDGRLIWGNLTVSLMRDDAGQPAYFISVIEDITERRKQERARDQMMHIISHELKTPLTSIKMLAQVSYRSLSAANPREAARLERIMQGTNRMELLINDLVDAARLSTGKAAIEPVETDLAALCRRASEEQSLATGRAITLELPAELVTVRADTLRIGQVLANMLSNALKYSPAERPVTLSLTCTTGSARVSVRDEGPGIPPEAQAQLFEQYYQVPGIDVAHGSGLGLGLGLFISRNLVNLHGGQMGVESKPGHGSTFWFTLPLAA